MAPTNLSTVKRQLKDAKHELFCIKKQRSPNARAKLAKAPRIGEFWLPLFVGPNSERINIHSHSAPPQTLAYLDLHRMPQCPVFIALPEQCPDMVKLYRLYLYTGNIFSESPDDKVDDDELVAINADAEWQRLANMYFLGLEFRDERFRNKLIDAIVDKVEEDPTERNYPTGLAHDVYANTVWKDPLRSLIVDLHVWVGKGEGTFEPHEDARGPGEFLRNFITTWDENKKKIESENACAPWEMDLCKNYHKHDNTSRCVAEGTKNTDWTEVEVIDLTDA